MSKNNIILETAINIFTVEKGILKVLLIRKNTEPYKGYWSLPGNNLGENETLEQNVNDLLEKMVGTKEIYNEQDYTFSKLDRNPSGRVLATSYIALTDNNAIQINKEENQLEIQWFDINTLPKMAYDHKEILEHAQELLKTKLINTNVLKNLFPSDFTLPELQNVYENIMNIKLDRRNFRKKFINLGLIEETGYNNVGGSGRPAKLYKFKENIKEVNLF